MPQKKPITIVGPKEYVDLPEVGIFGVPAKVDTGADSSAIWASNISETDGTLSFVLFDKSSPFYTGHVLTTTTFSVASIKNSFGTSEFRYKVSLKMVLAGRTIHVRFTLANRANNTHPILIGRRTLHGRFLVDVARQGAASPVDVLILTISRSERIQQFAALLESRDKNLRVSIATYDDLQFRLGMPDTHILVGDEERDLASYDLVHFKATPRRKLDVAAAAACYLRKRGVKFVDSAVTDFPGNSKLYQYVILEGEGITVPSSIFVSAEKLSSSYAIFCEHLGVPFVLKDIYGSRGRANFLIDSQEAFTAACKVAAADELTMIAQQFIKNTGDYRLLVLGAKPALIIYRQRRANDTHLNNTSQGGSAELCSEDDLPTAVLLDSIRAAKALKREIAGVDMVQDVGSGVWYCLEVNEDPQIASGSFTEEKLAVVTEFMQAQTRK